MYKEEEHVKGILQRCMYPVWALNWLNTKSNHKYNTTQAHNNTSKNKIQVGPA